MSEIPNVTLAVSSPNLEPETVEAVVSVPTYRRPEHLIKTLDSIAQQRSDANIALVVIENEAKGREGLNAVKDRFESGHYRGQVIIAHEQGNCNAYNAGWQFALDTYVNFTTLHVMDDDEIADVDWVNTHRLQADELKVDLLGGPQISRFEQAMQSPWFTHPVFLPYWKESGPVPFLTSSGNVMIKRAVLEAMGPVFLDPLFNFLGGGDFDFYMRCKSKGFSFGWCCEAPVYESVPQDRVEKSWIQARSIRNGVISTIVEKRLRSNQVLGQAKTRARSLALLGASPIRAAISYSKFRNWLNAIYPVHFALGRIRAEFGMGYEQYRPPVDS